MLFFLLFVLSVVALPFENLLGHSNTFIVPVYKNASLVKSIVSAYDSSICLDPSFTVDGKHPIILMMNWMTKLHTIPYQISYFSSNYNEFIVMVPHVVLCNTPDIPIKLSTSTVLYLTNLMAVVGGKLFYDLPKVLVSGVASEPSVMQHVTLSSEVLLEPLVEFRSSLGTDNYTYADVRNSKIMMMVEDVFSTTSIQKGDFGHDCFQFAFSFANATFKEASVSFAVSDGAVAGAQAFEVTAQSFRNPANELGAIWLTSDWKMSKPLQSCNF